MLEAFYPSEYEDSAYNIDFKKAYKDGIKGVIFDIDNTLVPHGMAANQQAIAMFQELHQMGMQTVLLSNNKEPRVKGFARQVCSQYIYKAGKPGKSGYLKAMKLMESTIENTLFVGDQLFTDIWGANRLGMKTILVKPIHPKEEIQIVLKRYLERIVLFFYFRKNRRG